MSRTRAWLEILKVCPLIDFSLFLVKIPIVVGENALYRTNTFSVHSDCALMWCLHFSLCVHCYYCSYFGLVFSTTPWPRLHRHDWYIPGAWRQERCVMLLFHKTSLPNKPGQFQLFGFIVTWFGFWKQNDHSSSSVTVATYAEKLTWFRAG